MNGGLGMKTVWIVNHYAQEPGGTGGTRHFALARHLSRHGWRAILIGSSIEHATGRQRLNADEKFRRESHEGVEFLWLRGAPYAGNGGARIGGMLRFALAAIRGTALAALPPPDAVIGSSVHPFAAWAAARLARRHRVPFLFEVRDLWPETLIEMGRLSRRSPVAALLYELEARLCRDATRILYLPPGAAAYFEQRGVPRDRLVALPNGVDLAGYPNPAPRAENGRFTAIYLGAHGQANALETVIRAAALAPEVDFRLIGDGPLKVALQALAQSAGATNIAFEPPVAKPAVPAVLADADALVLSVRDLPGLYRYGISMNKLYDYLAAARPIVLASGALNDPVAEAGAGISVPPEDPGAMAEAIRQLAAMPAGQRRDMGLAGRRYVEARHSYERLAGELAAALDAAVASP
jgi:glycosyltransferase involved in cell wall biosynthesis